MAAGFPRLLGDVGGTHARWAWQAAPGAGLTHVVSVSCAQSPTLAAAAQTYLREQGLAAPHAACIGIATAVTGDEVAMTNHTWRFSIRALTAELGLARCLVINDFTALAWSLPALREPDELRVLGPSGLAALAGAPRALLGPGTGLGVSGLVHPPQGQPLPLSGEGGHATLAAADEQEEAVVAWLRRRHGHASAERALSGPGLVSLHDALRELAGLHALPRSPAEVSAAAGAGDAQAQAAVRLFAGFLGSVAGNLTLTLGARGGVYVGGGIVPRLEGLFDEAHFRARFEGKGRFAPYLAAIPTWLITAPWPALQGAVQALDALPD